MADDDSQKTEDPTGKRLSDARAKGQVVRSTDVNQLFTLVGATVAVAFLAGPIATNAALWGRHYFEMAHTLPMDRAGVGRVLMATAGRTGMLLLLPMALMIAAIVIGPLVQHGFLWSGESLKPNLAKLNPIAGFGRIFSKRSLLETLKGVAKVVVIGAIAGSTMMGVLSGGLDHYIDVSAAGLLDETRQLTLALVFAILPAMMVIAGADWFFQRHAFMKQMRMSKQEVKDEFKNTEGDPVIKGRLKQLRFQRARQRMMQNVPKADVIITNPTHYAVALQYDPFTMGAPKVVALGVDAVAARIREVAEAHKIPIVRNPPVARALYAACDVDDDVPAEQYRAVAEIISYVFKLKGKKLGG
jgi:flagellar biosynthesis protein FlhB